MILMTIILLTHTTVIYSSSGDNSPFYLKCMHTCIGKNCTNDGTQFKTSVNSEQPLIHKMLMWSCEEECRYICTWKTVNFFHELKQKNRRSDQMYINQNWVLPKFHGKWPFIRFFGIQELGSVIGSLLNLMSNIYMFNKVRCIFSSKNTPLLWLWYTFAIVCINAWFWSIVFHTRDTYFTELMDYACALSMVLFLFVAFGIRFLYGHNKLYTWVFTGICAWLYISHVKYLYVGNVDYDYNMHVNIIAGGASCACWVLWAIWRWQCGHQYVWRLIAFYLLAAVMLLLEVLDFEPFMNLWDSHAVWHVATSPLPLIFYRFVIDDLHYLRQSWPDLKYRGNYQKMF